MLMILCKESIENKLNDLMFCKQYAWTVCLFSRQFFPYVPPFIFPCKLHMLTCHIYWSHLQINHTNPTPKSYQTLVLSNHTNPTFSPCYMIKTLHSLHRKFAYVNTQQSKKHCKKTKRKWWQGMHTRIVKNSENCFLHSLRKNKEKCHLAV